MGPHHTHTCYTQYIAYHLLIIIQFPHSLFILVCCQLTTPHTHTLSLSPPLHLLSVSYLFCLFPPLPVTFPPSTLLPLPSSSLTLPFSFPPSLSSSLFLPHSPLPSSSLTLPFSLPPSLSLSLFLPHSPLPSSSLTSPYQHV